MFIGTAQHILLLQSPPPMLPCGVSKVESYCHSYSPLSLCLKMNKDICLHMCKTGCISLFWFASEVTLFKGGTWIWLASDLVRSVQSPDDSDPGYLYGTLTSMGEMR